MGGNDRDQARRRRSRSGSSGRSFNRRRRESSPHSRSRSRSPKRRNKFRRSRTLSRSRSVSPLRRRPGHMTYESPEENECLGVFNLNPITVEKQVEDIFSFHGRLRNVTLIYDRFTGRSRGFGFVTYERMNDARVARERCNGINIDGRRIRVDFSATQRPHTPTPGMYMGKPSYADNRSKGGNRGGDNYDERWGRSNDDRWGRNDNRGR